MGAPTFASRASAAFDSLAPSQHHEYMMKTAASATALLDALCLRTDLGEFGPAMQKLKDQGIGYLDPATSQITTQQWSSLLDGILKQTQGECTRCGRSNGHNAANCTYYSHNTKTEPGRPSIPLYLIPERYIKKGTGKPKADDPPLNEVVSTAMQHAFATMNVPGAGFGHPHMTSSPHPGYFQPGPHMHSMPAPPAVPPPGMRRA